MAKKTNKGKKVKVIRKGPKILLFDIETAPMLAYVWGLWDQNVGLNQIKDDWYILSWAAKWLDDPPSKVMYMDQRKSKNIENDRPLLDAIWELLNEADIVITQNGKKFDVKKLNARFILSGMMPPSSFKHIDTLQIAKKHFAFTSHKLEYMSHNLNTKYKKLKHSKYSGFDMWKECLSGNQDAWKEMERYNKYDVLALEEVYNKLSPWDKTINFNLYHDGEEHVCNCGSTRFKRNGFDYTNSGKFQRYKCLECGKEVKDKENLLSREKRKSLKNGTTR